MDSRILDRHLAKGAIWVLKTARQLRVADCQADIDKTDCFAGSGSAASSASSYKQAVVKCFELFHSLKAAVNVLELGFEEILWPRQDQRLFLHHHWQVKSGKHFIGAKLRDQLPNQCFLESQSFDFFLTFNWNVSEELFLAPKSHITHGFKRIDSLKPDHLDRYRLQINQRMRKGSQEVSKTLTLQPSFFYLSPLSHRHQRGLPCERQLPGVPLHAWAIRAVSWCRDIAFLGLLSACPFPGFRDSSEP